MALALVLEQDPRTTGWIANVLAPEGLACVLIASSEALLEELSKASAKWDCILLAVEASAPRELQLLTSIHAGWPSIPVVLMVNGPLDISLASRAAGLGARDWWEKPLVKDRVRGTIREILAVRDPLQSKLDELRKLSLGSQGERLIGESKPFLDMLREVAKAATNPNAPVLITGETGVGKELIARAIHRSGERPGAPMIAVNLSAIPHDLVESHLFGHEKGAFTGALERRVGHLEEAEDGSLFLDELGELAPILQVKLLRVLQTREFRRLGGRDTLRFGARLISATNADLEKSVTAGVFREDLYHRIATYPIEIPALRHRREDLDLLRQHFLEHFSNGRRLRFAPETLSILRSYPFRGNIRELEGMIASAVTQCEGDIILPRHLPLVRMGTLARPNDSLETRPAHNDPQPAEPAGDKVERPDDLSSKLSASIPKDWAKMAYREVKTPLDNTFDRAFLWHKYERAGFKLGRAAVDAGLSVKTFRSHWIECGLPDLKGDGEDSNA